LYVGAALPNKNSKNRIGGFGIVSRSETSFNKKASADPDKDQNPIAEGDLCIERHVLENEFYLNTRETYGMHAITLTK
jgi:hypothetical protein